MYEKENVLSVSKKLSIFQNISLALLNPNTYRLKKKLIEMSPETQADNKDRLYPSFPCLFYFTRREEKKTVWKAIGKVNTQQRIQMV